MTASLCRHRSFEQTHHPPTGPGRPGDPSPDHLVVPAARRRIEPEEPPVGPNPALPEHDMRPTLASLSPARRWRRCRRGEDNHGRIESHRCSPDRRPQ